MGCVLHARASYMPSNMVRYMKSFKREHYGLLMDYFFLIVRGKDVRLSLHWNIIPNAGYLWRVAGRGNVSVTMPEQYTSQRPRK